MDVGAKGQMMEGNGRGDGRAQRRRAGAPVRLRPERQREGGREGRGGEGEREGSRLFFC